MLKAGDAVELVIHTCERTKLGVCSISIELWIDNVPVQTIVVVGSELYKEPELTVIRN